MRHLKLKAFPLNVFPGPGDTLGEPLLGACEIGSPGAPTLVNVLVASLNRVDRSYLEKVKSWLERDSQVYLMVEATHVGVESYDWNASRFDGRALMNQILKRFDSLPFDYVLVLFNPSITLNGRLPECISSGKVYLISLTNSFFRRSNEGVEGLREVVRGILSGRKPCLELAQLT